MEHEIAVNKAERMRYRALHTVARKHRNWKAQQRIQALSFDQDAMRQIIEP